MDSSAALRASLLGDGAAALGRLGHAVEVALRALRDVPESERLEAEYRCAELVWRYFVQREACGLASHDQAIEAYGIPAAVLAKVGARPPRTSAP